MVPILTFEGGRTRHGADPNTEKQYSSMLSWAAIKGHTGVVDILLEYDAIGVSSK